jgi:hypothetical protein
MCAFPSVYSFLPPDRLIYEPMHAVLLSLHLIILLCAPVFPSALWKTACWLSGGYSQARAFPTAENRVLFRRGPCGIKLHWDGDFLRVFRFFFPAVAQWLWCCAINRKVAGSIPAGVFGIFHWHNPSDRTMALGSTQPVTEMSTRSISWG